MAGLGQTPQHHDILGATGAIAILIAITAAVLAGPLVGCLSAIVGGLAFFGFVTAWGDTAPVTATILSVAIWGLAALMTGVVADRLRQQQAARRAAEAEAAILHARLESSLLPNLEAKHGRLRLIWRYLPSEARLGISGDFYDAADTPDGGLAAVVVGDVVGHGPHAAALGATLRASWHAASGPELVSAFTQVLTREEPSPETSRPCAWRLKADWIAGIVRRIKAETELAVTLSFGERPEADLSAWRAAGADRYLLRFETSDDDLYRLIHPDLPGRPSDRMALLRTLERLGYEVGSGIMVGIPGQTYASVADDIDLFRGMDLDMIGIGPYIAHPLTPLGDRSWAREIPAGEQVPGDELTVYKVVALARLVCPEANIPSTSALATINKVDGREQGLQRGANVVMPNLTPPEYRVRYEIYPDKACVNETAEMCRGCLTGRVENIGRVIGSGPGGRRRA